LQNGATSCFAGDVPLYVLSDSAVVDVSREAANMATPLAQVHSRLMSISTVADLISRMEDSSHNVVVIPGA